MVITMRKNVIIFLLTAMIALSGLTGCNSVIETPAQTKESTNLSAAQSTPSTSMESNTITLGESTIQTSVLAAPNIEYSSEDLDSSWDASSSTTIKFNNDSIEVSGNGASVVKNVVTINKSGVYTLSGTLNDGQVIVDTDKNSLVQLVLNGVNLSCSTSAPIYSKQADKTIITLADGSQNTITDATNYVYAIGEDEPDAAIFSKDSLTINGKGSLTVNGNFKNAIGTKDDLVIADGKFVLNAVNDALRGRDSVSVADGDFQIKAGSDGIQSNNDTDADKGWISLDGGTYNISAANDAVQAETSLKISAGDYNITTGGGSSAAVNTNKAPDDFRASRSTTSTTPSTTGTTTTNATSDTATTTETSDSFKALKGGTLIDITGGTFKIDSQDDAVHSNGNVTVNGGDFTISTGDDGFHADTSLIINDGKILINTSYEGLEGTTVDINGGDIRLTASDDGINAAGGNDDNQGMPPIQQDTFDASATTTNTYIRVKGGFLLVNASGDGLDSNGALYIDGGTVLVNGPTNSGNGALDYDRECTISGGTFIASGSAGMAQAPGTTSTQNSIMVYYTTNQTAGTLINISDSNGKSIATFAPQKDYQSVVISSPDLKQGEVYTVYSGGSNSSESNGGLYTGTYTAGTKKTDITISEVVTKISDDGSEVTAQVGMGGGKGGGGGRGMKGSAPREDFANPPDGTTPPTPPDGTTPPDAATTPTPAT